MATKSAQKGAKVCTKCYTEAENASCMQKTAGVAVHDMQIRAGHFEKCTKGRKSAQKSYTEAETALC